MKIERDSEVVELNAPPKFKFGERVKSKRTIRNDGTYAGKDIGEILVKKGDEGYVTSIGTFLQQYYIYAIDFACTGHRVGMRGKELDSLDNLADAEELTFEEEMALLSGKKAAAGGDAR